jgi:PAS domain S-box-containing protein
MLQHMNLMLDMAPTTIVVHTLEGRILYANQAAASIHGYRHKELMALKISDLDDEDSAVLFHERVERLKRNGEVSFEVLHRRKDGTTFPLKIFARTVDWDGAPAILSVGADITYRKQAEKEMRLTLKAVSEGVWKWDFITNELQFSPIYYTMLGYAPDAFPATFENWKRLIHPDDVDAALRVAEAFLNTEPDVYENVFRMRTQSGAYRWIQARGRVVERNASGAALRMIGNHVDITDRRRAEKMLRNVERRNQALLDHSPVCHKIVDLDFNLQYMSANGFKMLKLSADADVYGKPYPFAFFPEAFRNEMTANMNRAKETGGTIIMEALTNDVEGNEVWLDSTLVPVLDDDGNIDYLTVVSADVTQRKTAEKERKRLEGQLRQSQKMEAVGRLAGGVAHDFNNMLSLIIGHAEMALEDLDPTHPVCGDLEEIKSAGERSADLTRQLLAFARKQTVAPRVIDLNETVGGMLKMLRRLMGEDIDLAWRPGENIWPVKMDPSQIDQILANFCVNARDAIADVGKVAIETGNVAFDDVYCADHPGFSPGEYVFLSFSDNGCGMDPAIRDNIFEPFFTTKESGKGTGLGLATVYGIVKQNDGFINVYSESGLGTIFKIYLRRLAAGAESSRDEGKARSANRGHETILLVEDEPAILKMTMMMLESLGYRVMAAETPGEAVRLAREHAGDIHLLVSDVVMPEMNGRGLAKTILGFQPHIKTLYMSGYTSDIIAHHGVLDEGVNFIQKPFSRQGLGARVRAVLDAEKKSAE